MGGIAAAGQSDFTVSVFVAPPELGIAPDMPQCFQLDFLFLFGKSLIFKGRGIDVFSFFLAGRFYYLSDRLDSLGLRMGAVPETDPFRRRGALV